MSPLVNKPADPWETTLELIRNKACFSRKGSRRQEIFNALLTTADDPANQSRAEMLRKKFWPKENLARRKSGGIDPDHDQDAKVRGAIRYIRADLSKFFTQGAGKDHPWAIQIDDGTWGLRLVPNRLQQVGEDLLRSFWEPHLRGKTTILYPTPPFFEDGKQTFLRNLNATDQSAARKIFSYLNGKEFSAGDLTSAYQWTPIGAAVSMVRITQCLQSLGQQADIAAFRTDDEFNPHENIVLIGLPSAFSLVRIFEKNLPIRTAIGRVYVGNRSKTDDPTDGVYSTVQEDTPRNDIETDWSANDPVLWGSVTRRGNTDPRFAVTVIAGSHNRVVQEVADFLCNGNQLVELARKFDSAGMSLPEAFQARFKVEMHKASVGFKVSSIEVEAVELINWKGSVRSQGNRE